MAMAKKLRTAGATKAIDGTKNWTTRSLANCSTARKSKQNTSFDWYHEESDGKGMCTMRISLSCWKQIPAQMETLELTFTGLLKFCSGHGIDVWR